LVTAGRIGMPALEPFHVHPIVPCPMNSRIVAGFSRACESDGKTRSWRVARGAWRVAIRIRWLNGNLTRHSCGGPLDDALPDRSSGPDLMSAPVLCGDLEGDRQMAPAPSVSRRRRASQDYQSRCLGQDEQEHREQHEAEHDHC
jgi:hypothetical protein